MKFRIGENMEKLGQCAKCKLKNKICNNPDGKEPKFCSARLYPQPINEAKEELKKPDIHEFARIASIQEAECYTHRDAKLHYHYPVKPRLQEIIEFSKKMNYRKLGIAFCSGLDKEAEILTKILEKNNFQIISVVCKVGGIQKEYIGIKDEQKIRIGEYETMCNPIAQAKILNHAQTDFNILLGLCVGHDSLFMKYSKAMVTVFAVKDRLLGHNPLAALYTSHSYYDRFLVKPNNQ